MNRVYWLENGVFPCNIGFTTCRKAYAKAIEKYADCPEDYEFGNDSARVTIISKPKKGYFRTFLITLNHDPMDKTNTASLIAHEAVHVAQILWEQIGETEPGKEAEAYLVQTIVKQILNVLWSEDNR